MSLHPASIFGKPGSFRCFHSSLSIARSYCEHWSTIKVCGSVSCRIYAATAFSQSGLCSFGRIGRLTCLLVLPHLLAHAVSVADAGCFAAG